MAAALAAARSARSLCVFSVDPEGAPADFSGFSVELEAFSRAGAGCFSAALSVGFSDFSCGWVVPTVVEVFSILLAKVPSLPGRRRPRTATAPHLPCGWRVNRAPAQIDLTCRSLWLLQGTVCRDTRAPVSGPGPYPSILGGHPVSDRKASGSPSFPGNARSKSSIAPPSRRAPGHIHIQEDRRNRTLH